MILTGVARVDITPPIGMPHANWGSSVHQVAEGIDMPMYCYAMYLESESSKNKVILLSATPFNNKPKDTFSLIKLFQIPTRSTLQTINNLTEYFIVPHK